HSDIAHQITYVTPSIHCVSLSCTLPPSISIFFFFNAPATTEIYTLSLHDALPISNCGYSKWWISCEDFGTPRSTVVPVIVVPKSDRKSTRLNSSHRTISYAVFCLKKKKKRKTNSIPSNKHTPYRTYSNYSSHPNHS